MNDGVDATSAGRSDLMGIFYGREGPEEFTIEFRDAEFKTVRDDVGSREILHVAFCLYAGEEFANGRAAFLAHPGGWHDGFVINGDVFVYRDCSEPGVITGDPVNKLGPAGNVLREAVDAQCRHLACLHWINGEDGSSHPRCVDARRVNGSYRLCDDTWREGLRPIG